MKNIKFGVFGLGLLAAVVTAISSLSAQARIQVEPRGRTERPDVMVLDGRGAQLGVMVSDVDAKSAASGVKIDEVNTDSPAEKAGIKAGDIDPRGQRGYCDSISDKSRAIAGGVLEAILHSFRDLKLHGDFQFQNFKR